MFMNTTSAQLVVHTSKGHQSFDLAREPFAIGREPDNHLVISETIVSRYHARIEPVKEGYTLTDLSSANGTKLNDQVLTAQVPVRLSSGDRIEIGSLTLTFATEVASPPQAEPVPKTQIDSQEPQTMMAAPELLDALAAAPAEHLSLRNLNVLTIGRDPGNDCVIAHPTVSRFHARIERKQGSFIVTDLGSSNGTYVNGKRVTTPQALRANDGVVIGPRRLVLNINETFTQISDEGNLRLDAVNLNKVVGKGVKLLQNISLSILPREFVAVLGTSGSGKSTLLDALNGLRPATSGQVLVNGVDLYRNFQSYATQLGYVPQKNIFHEDLTVAQVLDFAAQLRMPPDTTRRERQQRIQDVLGELGLAHRQGVPVKLLSGGQQRRVAIGVELLTKPSLFFLDEATSGLDPGTEADIMCLLRQLADQGRTILLITHATQNVHECDLLLYLTEGGRIAYFGPPDQILSYFQQHFSQQFQGIKVQDLSGLYRALDPEKNSSAPSPEQLTQTFLRSSFYQQYVVKRQQVAGLSAADPSKAKRKPSKTQQHHQVPAWRQFLILSARNLVVLAQDRGTLLLMLAIAPLLGLLDFMAWKSDVFDLQTGSAGQAIIMLFVSALIAVMIGEITTMRELVKEDEIFRRERLYGLKLLPYILSKVWIAVLFSVYQAAAYLVVKYLAIDLPGGWDVIWPMYVTTALAIMAGAMLGLFVSAISPNQNMAPLLMILVLVPQIIFSGGVQPADNFGPVGQTLNRVNVIKWPFEMLVTLSRVGLDIDTDPCRLSTDLEREDFSQAELDQCQCFGPQVFRTCRVPGIRSGYVDAVDESEPAQPEPPANFDPNNPEQAQAYEAQLETWQAELITWQRQRRTAINGAEGVIKGLYDEQGAILNVDVPTYWRNLSFLIVGLLVLIPIAQKRKDI
ncbi:FHA domain-containing protein [Synechococcales cyanobacterium C]|uniref:FHA domain-containing protein n=1 Tax=Petrachloros mirabilis ULC683 TaxID=2781853 RepID=A0A8K1ZY03_9CYAN|nr:FHA domain-containing protein [Petrachloros mirabilis ULC683]